VQFETNNHSNNEEQAESRYEEDHFIEEDNSLAESHEQLQQVIEQEIVP